MSHRSIKISWLLASATLLGCDRRPDPGETENLPVISIGEGNHIGAYRALNAASELSVISDAWLFPSNARFPVAIS